MIDKGLHRFQESPRVRLPRMDLERIHIRPARVNIEQPRISQRPKSMNINAPRLYARQSDNLSHAFLDHTLLALTSMKSPKDK